jgi:hypothetical protein
MRGYPKGALTKVDYNNLLSMPEHSTRALADLASLVLVVDDDVFVDDGTPDKPILRRIKNVSPSWKRAGFNSKADLVNTVSDNTALPAPVEDSTQPIKRTHEK